MGRQDENPLQQFVNRLMARSTLTGMEQEVILALPTHACEVRAQSDILAVDQQPTSACLIAAGMVGRVSITNEGKRQFTAIYIPGDMADLQSAVRPVGFGGLQALSDATFLRVPHEAIKAVAARSPAIAEAFWRDGILDAAILSRWVVNIRRGAQTRVAHLLCELAIRHGHDRKPVLQYPLRITQEQLGDATGLTAVHVNRTLKSLEPIATFKRGTVQILDWAELAGLGDFAPAYLVADTQAVDHVRPQVGR